VWSFNICLVKRGVRNLVFLSRSAGRSEESDSLANELESMGSSLKIIGGSVDNIQDVRITWCELKQVKPTYSSSEGIMNSEKRDLKYRTRRLDIISYLARSFGIVQAYTRRGCFGTDFCSKNLQIQPVSFFSQIGCAKTT